ncbi:uncharacterized protein [Hemitrygon akajei]|uniref:uncharacterized protein n=1 Tax=Hemitrygon akajei TaxID=2704970 RepID=UPI003BF99AA4
MEVRSSRLYSKLLPLIQHMLLLSCMAIAGGTVDLKIIQHPPEANVSVGNQVVMMCSWNSSQIESVRVNWLKDGINIFSNKTGNYQDGRTKYTVEVNSSSLTIQSVSQNDSAFYLCEVFVEIPSVRKASGEGTILRVIDIPTKSDLVTWILVAISPIILIVFISLCYCFWRMKCSQRNDRYVYENSTAKKREAVKEKEDKRSQFYVNSTELRHNCQKTKDKPDNIYNNISVAQWRKHQTMKGMPKKALPSVIYQNNINHGKREY